MYASVVKLLLVSPLVLAAAGPATDAERQGGQQHRSARLMRDARGRESRAALLVEPGGGVQWLEGARAASGEEAAPGAAREAQDGAAVDMLDGATAGASASSGARADANAGVFPYGGQDSNNIHGLTVQDVAMTDGERTLKRDSILLNETEVFVEEEIAYERAHRCPAAGGRVTFTVTSSEVQLSEDIMVTLGLRLTNGASVPNVKVEWTKDPQPESVEALQRMESRLKATHRFSRKLEKYAKLIMPNDPCDLRPGQAPPLVAPKGSLAGAQSLSAPVMALENPNLDDEEQAQFFLSPTMGVEVEMELAAYRQGLSARRHARSGRESARAKSLPESFSWKAHSPKCLDYVHNQGTCGACYMFAALDSLSDRHCINTKSASSLGTTDHLSIQMALLCEPLGRQCSGGWADVGFNYTMLKGVGTDAAWAYERSCLSDSVCQFGKQCITPHLLQCPGFFSPSQQDRIETYADALREARGRCQGPEVARVDACHSWANKTFGVQLNEVFAPRKEFCVRVVADFKSFTHAAAVVRHAHGGSGAGHGGSGSRHSGSHRGGAGQHGGGAGQHRGGAGHGGHGGSGHAHGGSNGTAHGSRAEPPPAPCPPPQVKVIVKYEPAPSNSTSRPASPPAPQTYSPAPMPKKPSTSPTPMPAEPPTHPPTQAPTKPPTPAPTEPTPAPTEPPTPAPTEPPTPAPTQPPSQAPTPAPRHPTPAPRHPTPAPPPPPTEAPAIPPRAAAPVRARAAAPKESPKSAWLPPWMNGTKNGTNGTEGANGSSASSNTSNCSCHCFFSFDHPSGTGTFGDALVQALQKCEVLPQVLACKRWAERAFGAEPSAAFFPSDDECDKIQEAFTSFFRPLGPSGGELKQGMLIEDGAGDLSSEAEEQGARWFGWWGSRRRRTEGTSSSGGGSSSGGSSSKTTKTTTTTTTATTTVAAAATTTKEGKKPGGWPFGSSGSTDVCDRNRCNVESSPHSLTNYHYIQNTKNDFKLELYNDGPFYTSFYVYEDFTWFFGQYPKEAYNYQFGENLGGHAVVIVGWEASCTYHVGKSLLQEAQADAPAEGALAAGARGAGAAGAGRLAARARLHRQQSGASRRRTATGGCWVLRNTWGGAWADQGYFRMHEDTLTGPEGTHIHIASAAGDGAKSSSR